MSEEAISRITGRGGNGRNGDGTWPPTDGKGCPLCGAIGDGGHGGGCTNRGKRYDEQGKQGKPELHVEFSEVSASGDTRNGTVYGINAGTGKPMVAWAGGARDLSYTPGDDVITVPRMPEEDAELARQLREAVIRANKAWDAFALRVGRPGGGSWWSLDREVRKARGGAAGK